MICDSWECDVTESATESLRLALQQANAQDLSCVAELLKVVTTLPVTSCEAERAFSRLKHLKTPNRSTMAHTR